MLELNHIKFHTAILMKLNRIGMTQREFAKKIKTSRATIHRILHGKNIDTDTLFKIVYWLDVDLTDYMLIKPSSICMDYEKRNYRNYLNDNKL